MIFARVRLLALGAAVCVAACMSKSDQPPPPPGHAAPPAPKLTWSRAYIVQPAGAAPAVMYVAVDNQVAKADTLLRVTTPVVDVAMLHRNMAHGGNDHSTMSMVPVSTIEIPSEAQVQLLPGGTHIMLMPPFKQKLARGDSIPVTLIFAHAGTLSGKAAVIAYSDVDTATVMKLNSRR